MQRKPPESSHSAVAEAALVYLERGWSVIPVRPREKRPIIAWQIYQQQHATAADVERWFSRWPGANIAVVTGAISGLVVVDVDPRHGGTESIQALEREHGLLPPTIEARTGGGGRHLYFAHPGGHVHNRVDLVPGVDLRGDGGLVVAPPSVHPSGASYQWVRERSPLEVDPAVLPSWLRQRVLPQERQAGHPLAYWRELLAEGVQQGRRNSAVASIAGHLLWHSNDLQVVTELMLCWNRVRCHPPLPDEEVVQTVESIGRLHHQQRID